MTGRRPFKTLTKAFSPERRLRIDRTKAELLAGIEQATLADLREALKVSQEQLASALQRSQPAIAQMESRTDMKISTLRETIEALGGKLELLAHFPSGDISITRLGENPDRQ
ncbi:MAG: helix-turn-helix domain-containing protein [Hyphomicrobium zavarzinii]|jgi:ribosome-binding protein aMBF1 (putative translation factor)|nr:helix-turn-helix domain-containing protein [Hyphomicrobium zavarzinii]MBL8846805.1 helix-turn-helix domain-containing protein [Hyphomicrobium zavarzinii]